MAGPSPRRFFTGGASILKHRERWWDAGNGAHGRFLHPSAPDIPQPLLILGALVPVLGALVAALCAALPACDPPAFGSPEPIISSRQLAEALMEYMQMRSN